MLGRWLKRWRLPVAVVLAGVVVLAAATFVLYAQRPAALHLPGGGPPPTQVVVTSVDLVISYWTSNTSDTSYFDGPECDGCPLSFTPGAYWNFTFALTNGDAAIAHNVSNLTIGSQFVLGSVTPTLPYPLPGGQSVTVTIDLTVPTAPGDYFLAGSIGTD